MRDFARLLSVAVVLPALVLAALILWQRAAATRDQFGIRLDAAAESTAHEIDSFLHAHLAPIQMTAERRSAAGDLDDEAAWADDLLRIRRHYAVFTSLLVTDADARIRLIEPALPEPWQRPVADRSYFREPQRTRRAYVSDAFRGRAMGAAPLIAVSAPLFDHGRFAGVVQGSIRIDTFAALRSHWLQARDYEVLLLDRDGTVVHASSGLPYRSLDRLDGTDRDRAFLGLQRSRDRKTMQRLPGVLRDGSDAYARMIPLSNGWRLLLLVPESAVAAELRHNTLIMLALLALVLAGVLAVIGMQMRRLGASVQRMLDRMQRFALERAPTPIEFADMPRELAPLAEAMNQLAERAHVAYDEVNLSLREQRRLRQELQAMARHLLTVQENERRTLSRELHDDIGQAITAIKLGAMSLQDESDRKRRHEILVEIVAITDLTVTKLRNLSMLLRPPQLDTLGLETALRWQANTLFRSGHPRLELDLEQLPERPDPAVELACFRIAQEALTNILRHSDASRASLTLARDATGKNLDVIITDNGRGFGEDQIHGLGMVTMRERAQQLGGSLLVDTAPGQGARISLHIPMHVAGSGS